MDLILTGLPRSGTSLLCSLLNGEPQAAVINEPAEIYAIFHRRPWQLRHRGGAWVREAFLAYYRDLRQRVMSGLPVDNKLAQDTRSSDRRVPWVMSSAGAAGLVLGTKNTLVYTVNLGLLVGLGLRISAVVRSPVDSVMSWHSCTEPNLRHLRSGRIHSVRRSAPGILSEQQQEAFAHMQELPTGSIARLCAMWCFLAGQYLVFRGALEIIRYESLVADARQVICRVLDRPRAEGADVAVSRTPRAYSVSPAIREEIWARCAPVARPLGYQLDKEGSIIPAVSHEPGYIRPLSGDTSAAGRS